MLNTLKIFEDLKEELSEAAARKIAFYLGKTYEELANIATKEEIRSLQKVVAELAEAQKKAEERLTRLEQTVAELAEAQKKAEERLTRLEQTVAELAEAQKKAEERLTRLEQTVAELAEAQKKAEERLTKLEQTVAELVEAQKKFEERLTRLEQTVAELAEAQKKAEERLTRLEQTVAELAEAQKKAEERLTRLEQTVAELAEAQIRTEQRLNELAEAQKKTEEELRKLIGEHKKTREQLGGLAHTVGYILEDRAYKGLPELLKRDFAVEAIDFIKRDFIEIEPNRYEEINIYGKGRIDGREIWILGECKTQLKKTDIDSFLNKIKRIEKILKGEKIFVTVTYQASPPVRKYAQEKGVRLYFSYEMPL